MKNTVKILRVDPERRTVVAMTMVAGKNATSEVRRILRAKTIGWRKIMDIAEARLMGMKPDPEDPKRMVTGDLGPTPMIVAAGVDVDEAVSMWRIRGGDDNAGLSMVFGQGIGGGMVDTPVSVDWLMARIEWIAGESAEDLAGRVTETLDLLDDDMREAVRAAMPLADGVFVQADHFAKVGDGLLRLGLGTERTKGQKLSRLGEGVHDLLIAGGAR